MTHSIARPALVLGLMSCIGPFAIDMYLPAMPAIAEGLGASQQAMQGTITAYFVAFGLAQLVYGPWADQAGRKTPLYAGIAIFCIGALKLAATATLTSAALAWLIRARPARMKVRNLDMACSLFCCWNSDYRLPGRPAMAAGQSSCCSVSPSALTRLSICAGVLMKGGASWIVSAP